MADHDRDLQQAFDKQAAMFERSPVASDAVALERLVAFADLPAGSRVLDAGCGPGLVAEAFLRAGHWVTGVDLSEEMVARARARCAGHGDRANFERQSLHDPLEGPFDAAVSRMVLHHVLDPAAFLRRQAELLRPGGVLLAADILADPDPARRRWQDDVEHARDRTHVRTLTAGEILDLLAGAGLVAIRAAEDPFANDFDEWFDRGSPIRPKDEVRALLLSGPGARGFAPRAGPGGSVRIESWRLLARGTKPPQPR
ncbi:MAG TPA: methyltransferase domain-containing protein [Anaeromyxobacteraceae bacterium]|nr:methyltransferase domain-containing protein [Anaeromyxobacteraceae bacterium]